LPPKRNQQVINMSAKELIAKYGYTQKAVAEKIGVSSNSLNNCLRRGNLSQRTIHKIAEAIGADLEEFDDYNGSTSSDDDTPLYPEGTIDLGYVTLNGRQYRQLFVPAMT